MVVIKEEQHMTEQWIWCILCSCIGLCGWGVMRQITLGVETEKQSISFVYLMLLSAVPCLTLLYFYKNKLYTRYDEKGIKIKYFPFSNKTIPWNEVYNIEIGQLDLFPYSVSETEKYGKVYKAGSKTVLKIETQSEKLVISTTRAEEIKRMLAIYCPH